MKRFRKTGDGSLSCYDVDTGWYYLQSRYYNPEWGRFINADGYVNANGDLQGYNMFAYCSNNPVMRNDPEGDISGWIILALVATVIAIDHALANFAPEGLAVYDDEGADGFHDELLYAKGSGPSYDGGDITFVDCELGLYRGTSLTEIGDISVATFGTASAVAQADFSGEPSIEASAVASIYTISYANSFEIFGIEVNISGDLYYGGVGAGVEADLKQGKFTLTPPMCGLGGSWGIDFDY